MSVSGGINPVPLPIRVSYWITKYGLVLEGIDISELRQEEDLVMTDFVTDVDLRKLQVRYQRTPAGGVVEDIAVTTHHFLKLDGSTPTSTWATGDYTTVETAFGVFWGAIKAYWPSSIAVGQYRWYLSGGTWDVTPAPYNPAARITEVNVPGTSAAACVPPQCAISVTEKTALRPNWGRFYLPAPHTSVIAGEGRIATAAQTAVTNAAETLYNTCRAAKLVPVVFGRARGEYTRKDGVVLPPKSATAFEVVQVQTDDIFDVIRSRRWETVLARQTKVLAAL